MSVALIQAFCFSLLPIWWAVGLFFVALTVLLASQGKRIASRLFWAAGAYTVFFWLVCVLFAGVERKLVLTATWKVITVEGHQRVEFTTKGPESMGIFVVEDDALLRHLESKLPTSVKMRFTGTYDFGKLRAVGPPEEIDGIPVPPEAWR